MASATIIGPFDIEKFHAVNSDISFGTLQVSGDPSSAGTLTISIEDLSQDALAALIENYTLGTSANTLDASGNVVAQPYLTASVASGSVTVTLSNPPTTPPSSATVAIAGASIPVTLANNSGSITFGVDDNLPYAIPGTVTAAGCVGASFVLGTGDAPPCPLQVIETNGSYRIATTSTHYIEGYHAASVDQADTVNAIAVGLAECLHLLHDKVLPSLTASSYTPLTLTADEQNALNDLSANVLPAIVPTLGAIAPASGSEMPVYRRMKATLTQVQTAMDATNSDIAGTPNLQ